jgi:tight adherence protein C
MIRLLLLEAALAAAGLAHAAWETDRRLNGSRGGGDGGVTRLLVALGRTALPRLPEAARRVDGRAERALRRAGRPASLSPADLPALRAGATVVFGCAGALSLFLAPGPPTAAAAVVMAAFGWAYPALWLRSAAARRTEDIERAAPLALDLLATTVAAGVGVGTALRGTAGAARGPLREELELTCANLDLGRPRGEELRDLADRSGSRALAGLASALRLSDELGVPLAEALARQASRARAAREREVQRRAAVASPRILLVVVFVLVPASLLPLVAAVGLTLAGSLGGG